MSAAHDPPSVTICVLTFGDYFHLAERVLQSIWNHCKREDYRLIMGANAVCVRTLEFLQSALRTGDIDELIISPTNISKCPMMRRMFTSIQTDYIWWFDDDSYITRRGVLDDWLRAARTARPNAAIWGQMGYCDHRLGFSDLEDVAGFVRSASWYRGLPPPSWRPGGKGEFNFRSRDQGDGRWFFIFGGCWLIRTSVVRGLDWPDCRLTRHGDDVFLGEAIRQHGFDLENIGSLGVAINTEPRRGGWARVEEEYGTRALTGAARVNPGYRQEPAENVSQ